MREAISRLEEAIMRFHEEERRLRWFLSARMDEGGHTLLQCYDSINPDWIDAMQFGTSYEIPPTYKEGYEPQS